MKHARTDAQQIADLADSIEELERRAGHFAKLAAARSARTPAAREARRIYLQTAVKAAETARVLVDRLDALRALAALRETARVRETPGQYAPDDPRQARTDQDEDPPPAE